MSAHWDRDRKAMVEEQVAARGIKKASVLEAMRAIPRHIFVPAQEQRRAYGDFPIPIGRGQTISQPYMVALMTELLGLSGFERVLEIGTGSGYQAAILARLASEVISIERHPELAREATARLEALGYENVSVVCGDGSLGWPRAAPYDAIVVTAGSPAIPTSLTDQLGEGGRLVCPTGGREYQRLQVITRQEGKLATRDSIACIFVPLIGAEGWSGERI